MASILKLLTLNIQHNDNISFRHAVFVSGVLILMLLYFILYGILNYFVFHKIEIVLLDIPAAIITLGLLIYLHKSKNLELVAKLATFNVMFFLLIFIYESQAQHYSLIWTIFLPTLAIFSNGKRVGLIFSFIFYSILFCYSFYQIGIWDSGSWMFQDWVRFVLSSLLLTGGMYLNETAFEIYDKQLKLARIKEQHFLKELTKQSLTDKLTNLYNRRYYDNIIDKIIASTKRNKQCISFFILDIDYFKQYNDFYGHMKGDDALILVAKTIRKHIQREHDFVFRLGGEEFAGILVADSAQKTQEWICQLTKKIEDLQIPHSKSHLSDYLTVSIGIATYCFEQDFDADLLYKEADRALYSAKSHGRNRCEIAD